MDGAGTMTMSWHILGRGSCSERTDMRTGRSAVWLQKHPGETEAQCGWDGVQEDRPSGRRHFGGLGHWVAFGQWKEDKFVGQLGT